MDDRRDFIKAVDDKKDIAKFPIDGVIVKPALIVTNRHQTYTLQKAGEIIKEKMPGKELTIDNKVHNITMSGA
eukprot:226136-Heterocapsa_arctica.AAC.1